MALAKKVTPPSVLTDEEMFGSSSNKTPSSVLTDEEMFGAPKTQGLFGTHIGENSELLQKARIPQQIIKGASNAFMDLNEPQTTSVPLNALLRTPQTIASIGGELASSFVSPENAIVAGGLKATQAISPFVKGVGRYIGSGAQRLSGTAIKNPGVLAEEFNNPSLITKPGIETANEIYASKVDSSKIRDSFKAMLGKKEFAEAAYQALKDGSLTPDEALVARQTLDSVKNQVPRVSFFNMRKGFNDIAKTKFAGADEAYQTAVKAEALREPFPINKSGTPEKLLTYGMGGIGLGAAYRTGNPLYALIGASTSPLVQGVAAGGLGLANQQVISPLVRNPEYAIALSTLVNQIRNKGTREKNSLSDTLNRSQHR